MLRSEVAPWRTATALAVAVALVAAAVLWGRALEPAGHLQVTAPPFQGHYRFAPWSVVGAALFAVVAVLGLPLLARLLPWRLLLAVGAVASTVWAVLLSAWDGHLGLGSALARGGEYLPAVAGVGNDPSGWLSGFADGVAHREFPTHVNGHPPLMVLVFWAWERIGASGSVWAGLLVIVVGASATAAIAVTLRELGSDRLARRALPFLVLAPSAITVATSADSFFLGAAAWSAAALAVGLTRRAWPALLVAGVLVGALPYLSYGLVPFGAVLIAAGVFAVRREGHRGSRHAWRGPALALVVGLLVVPVAMTIAGFWWFDGLAATRTARALGHGDDRPYLYSLVADIAILTVLVGPATVVAALRRNQAVVMSLAGAALAGVLVLAVTGVVRLETERIWLPFAPWLLVLTSALTTRTRTWLALNAATALVFGALVFDLW